ncbi:hypothetical protein QJS10_CPA16g00961 [Acorus calamus]|uniref:Uncharacterized protein n=1 Tax=Acorus calamus TaxID=4465 RepID=A0AAV9D341_ACOCL|nr:hypothetical protein QJS10_CPA16g00961 [Acorus calamus]
MGRNIEDQQMVFHTGSEALVGTDHQHSLFASLPPKSPLQSGRPNSMVVKKVHTVIPPHIVAEAISQLHGPDLRWSGPITHTEMRFVEQYVHAKYPQYSHGLIEEGDKTDLYGLCVGSSPEDSKRRSPSPSPSSSSSYFGSNHPDLDKTQLEPSRLQDILTKKSSYPGSFVSIPEIQARNRVLVHCGLNEHEYLVLFVPRHEDAMKLIGESYPFFRYNCYMTALDEGIDYIREFATFKESKLICAPQSWLDLRIKGSQLSQYFRRKCKHSPKGLFAYPVVGARGGGAEGGARHSMHWVSEAHRNSWHVLLDASGIMVGEERLNPAMHRPDFMISTLEYGRHTGPAVVTCILVRRRSFDASPAGEVGSL